MALRRFFGAKVKAPVLPPWSHMISRDPFDYPLRSMAELKAEMQENPPIELGQVTLVQYRDADPKFDDPRNHVVKITIDMKHWNLTKKQED